MALPFKNPVAQCMPGFGSPSYQGSVSQALTATANITLTLGATATTPSSGGTAFNLGGGPAPTSGKWHVRIIGATGTATLAFAITVSDGTTTTTVATQSVSAATGSQDYTGEFKTDVSITAIAAVIAAGGTITAGSVDFEAALV